MTGRRRSKRASDDPADRANPCQECAAGPTPAVWRGRLGEDLALQFLRRRGYRLIARRVRTRTAELDLLLRRRRTLVAVEVKTRSLELPELAVRDDQLQRIEQATCELMPIFGRRCRSLRVDLVAVRVDDRGNLRDLLHLEGNPRFP